MSNWRKCFKLFGARVACISWNDGEIMWRFIRNTPFGLRAVMHGRNWIKLEAAGKTSSASLEWKEV